ncbi:MAG: ferrous iron transport protein A [Gallionellaceae bacterium]|nr:MAG: ferrous iron transport protein A [Gallionellaceae bacterium]
MRGTITDIHTDDALRQRLQALGFRSGKDIEIIRKASFGGPVHYSTVSLVARRA